MNQFVTIRQTLGLTQKELASILDISPRLLSHYENETVVLPTKSKNDLKYLYGYMKIALSYKNCLKTIADYVAERKVLEQLLQDNKKQRDQVTDKLNKAIQKNKVALAKKRMLWLLLENKNNYSFLKYQKLIACLQKPSTTQETDVMFYTIKLNTLLLEKKKLESQWRILDSDITFLESLPHNKVTGSGK
jgi:transcriptional regulator with XRE-family HTH domain